jgi:hypothetical protein
MRIRDKSFSCWPVAAVLAVIAQPPSRAEVLDQQATAPAINRGSGSGSAQTTLLNLPNEIEKAAKEDGLNGLPPDLHAIARQYITADDSSDQVARKKKKICKDSEGNVIPCHHG